MARSIARAYVSAALIMANAAARLGGSARRERGRRSLTDDSFIQTVKECGEADGLSGRIQFKLDKDYKDVKTGYAAAIAVRVADEAGCGTKPKRLFRPAGKHEAKHVAAGLDLWYTMDCGADDEALDAHATSLRASEKVREFLAKGDHKGIAVFEPQIVHKALAVEKDAYRSLQTHYDAINLDGAWEITTGDPTVTVQVLDSGLDPDHPDLKKHLWRNEAECHGEAGVDDDDNGFVDDCHGYNHADDTGTDLLGSSSHGTHCSGTIAADNMNGIGVAGVAGGDGTEDGQGNTLTGVRLMTSVGFGKTDVNGFAEGLTYGADNGARVSSNSWGYNSWGMYDQAELDAIDYYNSEAAGFVVFAAGNSDSKKLWYPGCYGEDEFHGAIGVAATTDSGARASFANAGWGSNYGAWVDISAPGVEVLSTTIHDECSLAMDDEDMTECGYDWYGGTSMATPHVAGAIALGLSVNPGMDRQELLECLYNTAKDISDVNTLEMGRGLLDAKAFVECCANDAPSAQPTLTQRPTASPTEEPTEQPTFSPQPTDECRCDKTLTLKITTDRFPSETTWELAMHDGADDKCVDTSTTGCGGFESDTEQTVIISTQICRGHSYDFSVTDSFGDGICCMFGDGSYELLLDGEVIASGGDFGSKGEHTIYVDDSSAADVCEATTCNGCLKMPDADSAASCGVECDAAMSQDACRADGGNWCRAEETPQPTLSQDACEVPVSLPNVADASSTDDFFAFGPAVNLFGKTLGSASLTMTWRDQGWGNRKGAVGVRQGTYVAHECCASHSPTTETIDLDVEALENGGGSMQAVYSVGGGGGHAIYISDATLTLNFEDCDDPPTVVPLTPQPTSAQTTQTPQPTESFTYMPTESCFDTDNGAIDSYGDGCADYNDYPSWCGNYDDDSFDSTTMCCVCGGGSRSTTDSPTDASTTDSPTDGSTTDSPMDASTLEPTDAPPAPQPTSTQTTQTPQPTLNPTTTSTSTKTPTEQPTLEPTNEPPTEQPTEQPSSVTTDVPTAFPACGVQVFRGTFGTNNEPVSYCETDPFKEKSAWGNRMAFNCCDEENVCARHDKEGHCYSSGADDAAWTPHSWFAAHDKCAKMGKKLCDVAPGDDAHGAPICKDAGCSYNYYAVWTGIACAPGDAHAPQTAECQGTAGAMCTDDWHLARPSYSQPSKDCAWVTKKADLLELRCNKEGYSAINDAWIKANDPSACCGCQGI